MKRIAPIRAIFSLPVGRLGALFQSERQSADLLQGNGSKSPEVQRQEMPYVEITSNAPSVQPLQHGQRDFAGSSATRASF